MEHIYFEAQLCTKTSNFNEKHEFWRIWQIGCRVTRLTQLRFRNNFIFFKDFNWIFPMFGIFHVNIYVFIQNWVGIGSGMVGNMLRSYLLCLGHAAGAFFSPKKTFFDFLTWSFFKKVTFRQKLGFWVADLERYLVKVVCMDHLGVR